jgi:hypothetical protein
MTKVIWLGEDTDTHAGPSFNIWNGVKFPKGVAVEVTDPYMLGKLSRLGENRIYKVIEEKQEEGHGESQTQEAKEQGKAEKEKDYDYRKTKKTGYSPVKKKVRKKKPSQERADDPVTPV